MLERSSVNNKLNTTKRAAVVAAVVMRNSIRPTARATGVSKPTTVNPLGNLAGACAREGGLADHVWSLDEIANLLERR